MCHNRVGNSVDSDDRHFATTVDSDMALLTLGISNIEFCNRSGHELLGILTSNNASLWGF